MKINKYISIDEDIFYKLKKETNASDIINKQLRAYYNVKDCENIEILKQNLYKIKQINKENRKKEKEIASKLLKLDQKNKDFFEKIKIRYPEDLVNKLKKIENLDYEAALALALEFDLPNRGIGGVKMIKIWEEIKNGMVQKK
jgi:D-hexose-6-phosphate mutarotase